MFMKKWLAIYVREESGNAHVEASLVSGGLKVWFRVDSLINHMFTEADLDPKKLLGHMNVVISEAISPIHDNQREIPVVVWTSGWMAQKLLPQDTHNALQSRSTFPPDVYLAEAWTLALGAQIAPRKIRIHPGIWQDEYAESWIQQTTIVLPAEVQSLTAQIRERVNTISSRKSLQFLKDLAYADGKDYARKTINSGGELIRFLLFDDTRLSPDDAVRYTYLSAHPLLKKEFVRWVWSIFWWLPSLISSKNSPIVEPCYMSIKTRKDPKAAPFCNVVMTYLAEQSALLDGEGIAYGHIQEKV